MKPLSEVPLGKRFRIAHVRSHHETSTRLREMGFYENAVVRCVNKGSGGYIICEICNTRIGLNQLVASAIFVTALN
jgi:Fe2+ transport system protein FeoA